MRLKQRWETQNLSLKFICWFLRNRRGRSAGRLIRSDIILNSDFLGKEKKQNKSGTNEKRKEKKQK